MRGRTNITQRSGTVPVNGDIGEFTVADGKTIEIGDFVSMIYGNASYYDGFPDSYDIANGSNMFGISDNKFVAFYGQNICIFNTSINGGIEVDKVISGTFHSVGGQQDFSKVYKIDNSHFAIAYYSYYSSTIPSSNSKLYIDIVTLDVENNTAIFVTKGYSLSFSSSLISKYMMGIICNSVIFIPYIGKEGTDYYRNLTIAWFDINIGDCGICAITDYNYALDDYKGVIVQGENNEIYAFTTGYKSLNTKELWVSKFTFSSEERSLVLSGMYYQETENSHVYYTRGIVTYLGNDMFSIVTSSKKIEIVEIKESITLLNSVQILPTSIMYTLLFKYKDKCVLFGKNSSNLIMYTYVINLDELLNITSITFNDFNLITIYSNISNNIDATIIVPFENYFVLYGNKQKSVFYGGICCLCKIIGNNLSGMDSDNFVIPYNRNSIGFAKTGGTSGETIQVYVPKSN